MTATCVALVDDEAPVRVALGRLLRLAGHTVLAFGSGDEFLASLPARMPDCVLLDVHMPGLTGLQVQARLRDAGMDIPVIFITASDDADIARRALEAGGLLVLHKPFSNELLLDAVGVALTSRPGRTR
jgi:two-component system, LuxR family, response regulator FixJ